MITSKESERGELKPCIENVYIALDQGKSGIPQTAYRTVAAGTCFPPEEKNLKVLPYINFLARSIKLGEKLPNKFLKASVVWYF